MIANTIRKQIADALKARDEVRLSTLRMLASALNYEKIDKQHELSGEEELVVVRHEAKKRHDAIEALRQASGKSTSSDQTRMDEKLAREIKELKILQGYLPEQLGDEKIKALVDEVILAVGKDFGKVMGTVMRKVKGKADGNTVSKIVKEKLS